MIRYVLIATTVIIAGCSGINSVTDAFVQPTARDIYKREFKDNKELFTQWKSEFDRASNSGVLVSVPYQETGLFSPLRNAAYSYEISMVAGEKLSVTVHRSLPDNRVFIDLLDATGQSLASADPVAASLESEISESGNYTIVIQPEIRSNAKFSILINKKPSYGFPVQGKGNAAIWSFWGDVRDGGKRSHEGIDIFAKRGTPVVAVTDGTISFTGERGLGGKQVWQRAGIFGNSIYYAHLDGIAVTDGQRVKTGDVLGYLGSTGNAEGGKPHLHFGIYRHGAIDPLPFVYQPKQITFSGYNFRMKSENIAIKSNEVNFRLSPNQDASIIKKLRSSDQISVLGQTNDWLHIQTSDKVRGFIHRSTVREL